MNASKIYFILKYYIDLPCSDIEDLKAEYIDIKNNCHCTYNLSYGGLIKTSQINYLAENCTKKQIKEYLEKRR